MVHRRLLLELEGINNGKRSENKLIQDAITEFSQYSDNIRNDVP